MSFASQNEFVFSLEELSVFSFKAFSFKTDVFVSFKLFLLLVVYFVTALLRAGGINRLSIEVWCISEIPTAKHSTLSFVICMESNHGYLQTLKTYQLLLPMILGCCGGEIWDTHELALELNLVLEKFNFNSYAFVWLPLKASSLICLLLAAITVQSWSKWLVCLQKCR